MPKSKKIEKVDPVEVKTETYELDDKALGALAGEVVKGMTPIIEKKINEAMDESAEKTEKTIDKAIAGKTKASKGTGDVELNRGERAQKFVEAVRGVLTEDKSRMKEYNELAMGMRTKAGYQNTGTSADGGYIVLDPEFEAEIETLSEEYGVALSEAKIVPIQSGSVKTNKRGSNVTMYEIGEGATITSSKLTIEQVEKSLRKFAGLAITTSELTDDQAIDFVNALIQGFAEERARITDVLVFTDDNATFPGLLHADDTIVETVGALISSITWDDLLNAQYAVPTKASKNGKFYMHRTIWNILLQVKDDNGRYQLPPSAGLVTPWGTPVVLVDQLPDSSVVGDSNEGYVIFGDLKRVPLYIKKGLTFDESKDATVTDTDDNSVNLFEQDMKALRAITRMLAIQKFPEAFCIIGTGTVS